VIATALDIQNSGSLLRVGTFGRGVWEIPLNSTYVPTLTASFSSDATSVCKNGCINFFDNSVNSAVSWNWTFTGATPSSSNQKNPTNICYSDTGTFSVSLTVSNAVSNDSKTITDYVKVMDCTSINKVESEEFVKIFPNPNSGSFNIEVSDGKYFKEIIIYNILGEKVFSSNKLQTQYQFTKIPKGTYLVEVIFTNRKVIKKIMVM
jgi:PKD repeat protein